MHTLTLSAWVSCCKNYIFRYETSPAHTHTHTQRSHHRINMCLTPPSHTLHNHIIRQSVCVCVSCNSLWLNPAIHNTTIQEGMCCHGPWVSTAHTHTHTHTHTQCFQSWHVFRRECVAAGLEFPQQTHTHTHTLLSIQDPPRWHHPWHHYPQHTHTHSGSVKACLRFEPTRQNSHTLATHTHTHNATETQRSLHNCAINFMTIKHI